MTPSEQSGLEWLISAGGPLPNDRCQRWGGREERRRPVGTGANYRRREATVPTVVLLPRKATVVVK